MQKVFVFIIFFAVSLNGNSRECLPSLDLIPFEAQNVKDSVDLKMVITGKDSAILTSYMDSAGSKYRKDFYRGGRLMRLCEVKFVLQVDTEFIENEYGEITPVPIVGDWIDICIGTYEEYFHNGALKTKGQYQSYGKNGLWTTYYNNYNSPKKLIRKQCTYYDGYLVGAYIENWIKNEEYGDPDVKPKVRGKYILTSFKQGHHYERWVNEKVGEWKKWDWDGNLVSESVHKVNGKIVKQ